MPLSIFIHTGLDDYITKSLDHTGLVQREVPVQGKHGTFTRKQWVKANESDSTPTKRQVPATPVQLTERTSHLVPLDSLNTPPEWLTKMTKPIPPNWRNVYVSPDPNADILVVGKDDMDRQQYIYNHDYVTRTTAEKFNRVKDLLAKRSTIESCIRGMKDRETGDCLLLILNTGIRPGSTRDTRSKVEALGATTLRGENVVVEDGKVFLSFTGKKGVSQHHEIVSRELSEMLLKRKSAAGDKGDLFNTDDRKLRAAMKPLGAHPKDLRTMLASDTAKQLLSDIEPVTDAKQFIKIRNQVGDKVCSILGNQRAIALSTYIDPSVFVSWSPEGVKAWELYSSEKKAKKAAKSNGK